jgi:hypothetical protein
MKIALLAAVAATLSAAPALAQQTVTTLDGSQGFAAPAGELNPSSSATITSNTALSADGSLQLSGDRTRVLNGNNYAPTTNYGAANDLVSLTGDYLVLNGGTGGIQSPAFRVYIQDGSQRSELIFEAAYNGGYTIGTPNSVTADSLFYQNIAGLGPTFVPGTSTYVFGTLASFGDTYSANAFVSAFGVGDGSGAGAGFNALADNLALTTSSGTTSVNFASSSVAAVPEPATWALMLIGFGGMGASMRRSRKTNALRLQAA